ncbi:MAG: hypothetical protein LBS69_12250 [Prevotellaceae bacterium]|nr:hypothetical protein [Prevotellaceae bacterium]
MNSKAIAEACGLTNINDKELVIFMKSGISAKDLIEIDNLLTIVRVHQISVMNKRQGKKRRLKELIEKYIEHITGI